MSITVNLGMLDMHISLSYNSSAALKSKQLEGMISNKLQRDVRKSNRMFENGSQIQHQGNQTLPYVERSLVVFEMYSAILAFTLLERNETSKACLFYDNNQSNMNSY